MGAIRNRNVAKIHTSYVKQQEEAVVHSERKRKLLFRRLAVFFVIAAVISFFMVAKLYSQSSILEEKMAEKKKLEQELAVLKNKEMSLEDEIVKLNDDDYIAKLARKDYFLSEKNEIIFNLPDEKGKEKENQKDSSSK